MLTAWRILKAKRAQTAFDGEGARLLGGRWNSQGLHVVYTAQSIALAALEILAHLNLGAALEEYVTISCSFDTRLVEHLDRSRLPVDWRRYPPPPTLQSIGNEWLKSDSTPILEVPSALIPSESIYLLNPLHPRFKSIRVATPEPFRFDLRLLRV